MFERSKLLGKPDFLQTFLNPSPSAVFIVQTIIYMLIYILYIYIITLLEHTLFLGRSCMVFGYVFFDSEYHEIYFMYYYLLLFLPFMDCRQRICFCSAPINFSNFSGQQIGQWRADSAVFYLVLCHVSSFLGASFAIITFITFSVKTFILGDLPMHLLWRTFK